MWTTQELVDIDEQLEPIEIEDVVTTEELSIIAENSTRLSNLKTGLTIPKNHLKYSNIRITQIWNNKINLFDWVGKRPESRS